MEIGFLERCSSTSKIVLGELRIGHCAEMREFEPLEVDSWLDL